MRKNKSFKDNSFGKGRRSQGKEISIDLDPSLGRYNENSHRYEKNPQLTDRHDRSLNPISQNILKDIINYSHISHSHVTSTKGTTLASYQRHQDIMSQFNKINKKTSLGDLGRKDNHKLTLDHPASSQVSVSSTQFIHDSKSLQMVQNQLFGSDPFPLEAPKREDSAKKKSLANSIITSQINSLQKDRYQLAAKLDQLQLVEDAIVHEYSEMVAQWEEKIKIEANTQKEEKKLSQLQKRGQAIRGQIDASNDILLTTSRDFVDSRRRWDEKGNGARNKVLDESIFAHEDFLRRLTVRDFEQSVLFNMKVAIPDHKGKVTTRGIYEQLYNSKCAKKFTMILKKHAAHMDLYDGKLLSDFTKRINDLEAQYCRCQGQSTPHNDEPFLHRIELIVSNIEQLKFTLENITRQKSKVIDELTRWRYSGRQCDQRIQDLIEEMNARVRGQYQRQTEKAADFKNLLIERYSGKYFQFKRVRMQKQMMSCQLQRVQLQLEPYNN